MSDSPIETPGATISGGRVVLLVAHGSRNPDAAAAHEQLCDEVQAQVDAARTRAGDGAAARAAARAAIVRPAYLEITAPSIPDAIDAAVAGGATEVRLLPHFLSPGNHVQVDLPALVAAARTRHPDTPIELAEHLGADPGLVALLATRVAAD
jgi:sirohydrochlorin ferrochelatase